MSAPPLFDLKSLVALRDASDDVILESYFKCIREHEDMRKDTVRRIRKMLSAALAEILPVSTKREA